MKNLLIKLKKHKEIVGAIVIAVVFFFGGFFVGHENLQFQKSGKVIVLNKSTLQPKTVDFSSFWETWNKVVANYAGTVDPQKMINGAISGMVSAVGDPYTIFMDKSASQDFANDLSGTISGIGAQIDQKNGQIIIVAPLADSPAEKAGLKPQDQILKIDDIDTSTLTVDEAVAKIRGNAGTHVKLTVMRSGWTGSQVFDITRAEFQVKSVTWEEKANNIAYIQITQFGDDTTSLFTKAAKEIDAKHPKAIVLDLRSNPGGYLESAVDIASFFNSNQVVVKEQDKNGKITEEKTDGTDPILGKYKTVVLVDGGSASAAEILSGALQDWGKATLVGEKTFGKGSVQELLDINGGGELKVTIAKWLTPKNRTINGVGLMPDVSVTGEDSQLNKALELAGQ